MRGVVNTIEVNLFYVKTESALERRAERHARHITIDVRDGTAELRGQAESWAEREAIFGAARYTPTKIADVCAVYRTARERAQAGQRTLSTDNMTGVQALERLTPDLPPRPGWVARREFEYKAMVRARSSSNFDVATGQVFSPSSERANPHRS